MENTSNPNYFNHNDANELAFSLHSSLCTFRAPIKIL